MIEILDKEKFKAQVFDFTANAEWKFEKSQPIILNFFATWCGPCHQFAPTLEEVANQHGDRLRVFKIDIDKDPEISHLFGIKSVPTTLFLTNNEEPVMTSGALTKEGMDRAVHEIFHF